MSDELIVQIEVIGTPGKNALYINGRRVAGSKPWGGGRTIEQWNVKQSELVNAIGNTQAARIAELENLVAYLCGKNADHIRVALAGNPIVVDAVVARAEAALEGGKKDG